MLRSPSKSVLPHLLPNVRLYRLKRSPARLFSNMPCFQLVALVFVYDFPPSPQDSYFILHDKTVFAYGQTREIERTYMDYRLFTCCLVYEFLSVLVRYTLL